MAIRVGVGGWTYEPWRGVFYPGGLPHKDELAYAAKHLTSIEINGTYYRNQSPETFAKWRDETPDDFVFSVKAPRYIMGRKVLAEAGESIEKFATGAVKELGPKLGPINWQFEHNKFEPEDFEAFLKYLPTDMRHAIEVRNKSFKCLEFVELAKKYNVAIVVSGDSSYPLIPDITADFSYLRIMGTQEASNGYPTEELDRWAERAKTLASGEMPSDLPAVSLGAAAKGERDVFLYVISGFKQSNPAMATELIGRI
ncbi:MAG TPA: DUF72 domain-containing protein [Fimbriimonas sp.]|nr:DUF72 domain-containing protein [Fimbriimonas sp.]